VDQGVRPTPACDALDSLGGAKICAKHSDWIKKARPGDEIAGPHSIRGGVAGVGLDSGLVVEPPRRLLVNTGHRASGRAFQSHAAGLAMQCTLMGIQLSLENYHRYGGPPINFAMFFGSGFTGRFAVVSGLPGLEYRD
jgi:hypothetical protein